LARTAHEQSIPFFLPVYTRRWQNAGRTFSAHLPLFPGYFFLHSDEVERQKLLEGRFVANSLPVIDQDRLHSDLARVYELMARGLTMTPEEQLCPGTRVRITDGPMRGMEGKVLRQGKKLRLVIEVDFVRRGVSVEIENWMVAALPGESRVLARV
jgi:transcriptional antiterminator RfaH